MTFRNDEEITSPLLLIIEDDERLSDLIQNILILKKYPLRFIHVSNGAEALELAASEHPKLILLDYSLPDMNGARFIESLAERGTLPPFIVMTGHGDERIAVNMMKQGARDYLFKDPMMLDVLPKVILRVLQEIEIEETLAFAQAESRKNEEKFRRIFTESTIGIMLYNVDGMLLDVNPAGLKIFGVTAAKDLETLDLFSDSDFRNFHRDHRPGDKPARTERRFDFDLFRSHTNPARTSKTGSAVLDILISPIHDQSTDIDPSPSFLVHVQDITERKELEEMILRSKQDWERTFDAVTDAIHVTDLDFRIVRANKAAGALVGKEPSELIGKHCWELFHDPPGIPSRCPYRQLLKGEMDYSDEAVMGDSGQHYLVSVSPVSDSDGNLTGAVHVAKDITKRKRTEEQIKHAQKIESLGIVAGGVAHDFNNFLTGILGYAELALDELPLDSPASTSIRQIRSIGKRMAAVSRQILAYTGRTTATMEQVDLSTKIKNIEPLVASVVRNSITVHYRLAEHPLPVPADPGQLTQIVMNLINNAVEALENQSGTITVSTGIRDCDTTFLMNTYVDDNLEPGQYAFLSISDTGAGIDAKHLDKIFDPFFTTKFVGRGLGLAVVLGIVRSHKGALKVESMQGKGSTFTVFLPGAVSSRTPVVEAPNRNRTILFIDNDDQVGNAVQLMLQRHGYRVLIGETGRKGRSASRAQIEEADLAIIDIAFSGTSGQNAYRMIGAAAPNLPVIITGGHTEEETRNRIPGLKLSGFLQKPYSLGTLLAGIDDVLGLHGKHSGK